MPGLLIIAHAPLASSLKAVARHVYPDSPVAFEALDVEPSMTPEQIETQAAALSPVLIRAFQVAASPEGGVHAAVQFLTEYAAAAPA